MTEITELNNALHGSVNSAYQSFEDGDFDFTDVVQYWIDDIGRWQKGIEGFKPGAEILQATNDEMVELKAQASAQMANLPEDDSFDIAALTSGLWSGYRIVARKAFKQGEESALKKLEEAGVITDVAAAKKLL